MSRKATVTRSSRWTLEKATVVHVRSRQRLQAWMYTVSIGDAIYVVHAFQKKSKAGIATPKSEMELVMQRLRQLRCEVRNAEKKNS